MQSERVRAVSTRNNQMTKGKHKNPNNTIQFYLTTSEPSYPNTPSPGYPNTPEKQDSDQKSHLMNMIKEFRKDINNSLN